MSPPNPRAVHRVALLLRAMRDREASRRRRPEPAAQVTQRVPARRLTAMDRGEAQER